MNSNDCKFLLKSCVFLLFFCQFKYCSAGWKFNVESANAIISEDPGTATKNIATAAGVIVTTTAVGLCATNFWNPVGIIGCGAAAIVGVTTSIVAPDYIAPDPRYKCSPEEYRNRANKLVSLLPENKRNKENMFDIFHHLDRFCENQCKYPTRINPIGGDRCSSDGLKLDFISEYRNTKYDILGSIDAGEFIRKNDYYVHS